MAVDIKGKSGGGKLTRTETVTVRLDPKLRYLAELAARKQRRTVSSFIEWAIEDTLKRIRISDSKNDDHTIHDEALELWDVDEADRFAKLALHYPELLTHDEQVMWKLIEENGHLWKGKHDSEGDWTWSVCEIGLVVERLREHWDSFKAVARGKAEKSTLPDWERNISDSIPF